MSSDIDTDTLICHTMIDYFKREFQKIADSYHGEYFVKEEIVGGIGGSDLPLSHHCIIVPHQGKNIYFNMEFGGTAFGEVKTEINQWDRSKRFELTKKDAFMLLLSKVKKSLWVKSESELVNRTVEAKLKETGLENIASETLFEPKMSFKEEGRNTLIEMTFSMAFKDKEKAIVPIIEFMKKLVEYLKIDA